MTSPMDAWEAMQEASSSPPTAPLAIPQQPTIVSNNTFNNVGLGMGGPYPGGGLVGFAAMQPVVPASIQFTHEGRAWLVVRGNSIEVTDDKGTVSKVEVEDLKNLFALAKAMSGKSVSRIIELAQALKEINRFENLDMDEQDPEGSKEK